MKINHAAFVMLYLACYVPVMPLHSKCMYSVICSTLQEIRLQVAKAVQTETKHAVYALPRAQ